MGDCPGSMVPCGGAKEATPSSLAFTGRVAAARAAVVRWMRQQAYTPRLSAIAETYHVYSAAVRRATRAAVHSCTMDAMGRLETWERIGDTCGTSYATPTK